MHGWERRTQAVGQGGPWGFSGGRGVEGGREAQASSAQGPTKPGTSSGFTAAQYYAGGFFVSF